MRAGNPPLQATKPISYMSLGLEMRQWRRPYIQLFTVSGSVYAMM